MDNPNLFDESTHELSHSAFLSWLYRSAMADPDGLPYKCATQLFQAARPSEPVDEISITSVEKEHALPEAGRIDLLVTVEIGNSNVLWGIETKRRSKIDEGQLKRYEMGLQRQAESEGYDDVILTLYTTRHVVRGLLAGRFSLVKREDVLKVFQQILGSVNPDHRNVWLLSEYRDWLHAEQQIYDRWSDQHTWSHFVEGAPEITDPRIAEIVHYRFFVDTIAKDNIEQLYWGTNSGGQPWIQYKITHPLDKAQLGEAAARTKGTLFYRMDLRSRNGRPYPYLEIRQYTETPGDELLPRKRQVGEAIRRSMTEAVFSVLEDHSLPMTSFVKEPPYTSASYRETALCGFHFLKDSQPDLAALAEVFPNIHEKFILLLKKNRTDSVGEELK